MKGHLPSRVCGVFPTFYRVAAAATVRPHVAARPAAVRHGAAAVVLLLRRSRHSSSTFGCHRASIHHPRAQIERRWASIWLPSHKSRVPNHQRPSPTAEQQISAIWPPSASSCAGPQPLPHATVCSSAAVAATSPSLVMVPHLPPPRTRLRRPSSGQMLVAAARPVARLAARCRLHFAGWPPVLCFQTARISAVLHCLGHLQLPWCALLCCAATVFYFPTRERYLPCRADSILDHFCWLLLSAGVIPLGSAIALMCFRC